MAQLIDKDAVMAEIKGMRDKVIPNNNWRLGYFISIPRTPRTAKAYDEWKSDTATITVRAYKWQGEYYIDWTRRCAEDRIAKVEKLFNSL